VGLLDRLRSSRHDAVVSTDATPNVVDGLARGFHPDGSGSAPVPTMGLAA
jgi:hypothetical protein